jgi:hypothetical protein
MWLYAWTGRNRLPINDRSVPYYKVRVLFEPTLLLLFVEIPYAFLVYRYRSLLHLVYTVSVMLRGTQEATSYTPGFEKHSR